METRSVPTKVLPSTTLSCPLLIGYPQIHSQARTVRRKESWTTRHSNGHITELGHPFFTVSFEQAPCRMSWGWQDSTTYSKGLTRGIWGDTGGWRWAWSYNNPHLNINLRYSHAIRRISHVSTGPQWHTVLNTLLQTQHMRYGILLLVHNLLISHI